MKFLPIVFSGYGLRPQHCSFGSIKRHQSTALFLFVLLATSFLSSAPAKSPVIVTLHLDSVGPVIPDDFIGLSYETQHVLPGPNGEHSFSASNSALVRTFKLLGVRSLRVGGNTADSGTIPSTADADELFAFARAATVKVIFTLKLKNSSARENAPIADHIVTHYAADLTCFSVGNEPTSYIKSFSEYETLAKSYMQAISHDGKFCGADVEDKGQWATDYADAFKEAPNIRLVTQHHYLGNGRKNVGELGRDAMLSSKTEQDYTDFFNGFGPAVAKDAFSFRLSETNSFFHGGAVDASDTFASALWGLDYLHWWAAHGAAGLNFHTGDTVSSQVGGPNKAAVYAVFVSSQSGYHMRPLGYGIKAFDVGGHGTAVPLTITNSDSINFTAYGVLRSKRDLYVTLINREHDADARSASVTVVTGASYKRAAAMFLRAPGNEVSSKDGATLGGAAIDDDGTWKGAFSVLRRISQGKFEIELPPATAVVLHLE